MEKGLIAAALSLAIIFQGVAVPSKAHAAVCSVAGGQSGRLKYSSQLNSVSATVCGNQIWKLLGKPKKPTKPVKPSKPKKYANNFTVIPDRPRITGPRELKPGESGYFNGLSVSHLRNRLLFWYPSQVRFSPRTFDWNFGDGNVGAGKTALHSWARSGEYSVKLRVGFAVKYRIIGHSGWVVMPGLVYATSVPAIVKVGWTGARPGGPVVLVHWTCDQKPTAIGC